MRHKHLSDAIDDYLAHLKAKGLEPRTIKTHAQPLRACLVQWGNIYMGSIRHDHIDRIFSHSDWQSSTRNLYLGSLRQFFTYARRQAWISKDYDPTEGWRPARVPKREHPRVAVEEFAALLAAATDPRDRAVVALGLFTFCRASEIQTLRIRDLDFKAQRVNIYRHKTKEADRLPMALELQNEMTLYLNFYSHQQGGLNPDWFLVPAKGPLPMGHNPATRRLYPTGEPAKLRPERPMSHPYRATQRPLRALGYTGVGLGGHCLRRGGARALFDRLRSEGYDGALMRVSAMLGHSSTKITEHYLSLGIEREQRNELLAGKPMFPDMAATAGSIYHLNAV